MKRTYDFATIGFRPFTETQEFVTMGVVALDTTARHFDFVIQDARKTGRVLGMFPKAGKVLYREARNKLETELEGIRQAVNGLGVGVDVPIFPTFRDKENGLFAAITSPREGVFCFPVKGRRMAADMKTVLEALKTRFIDQDGLTVQQAVEQEMARELRRVLKDAKILPAYLNAPDIAARVRFIGTFSRCGRSRSVARGPWPGRRRIRGRSRAGICR